MVGDSQEMASSRHNKADAHMNSQDLHRLKPLKFSACAHPSQEAIPQQ